MRFFADQCVPFQIVLALRAVGYEVFILREHINPTSRDCIVIDTAQSMNAILLSLNGDFADIVSYPPKKILGIFCLQIKNHPETAHRVVQNLINYLKANPEEIFYRSKLFVVDQFRIRVRS